jgi:hypothetical protein
MKKSLLFFLLGFLLTVQQNLAQTGSLSVKTFVSEEIQKEFKPSGRIFLFVNESRMNQPRQKHLAQPGK